MGHKADMKNVNRTIRAVVSLTLASFLAGCVGKPVSMGSTVPVGYDAYACAMRELARSEFTIQNTDRESGFIQASRQTSGSFSAAFGETEWDQITVMIFEDAGAQSLRVTASKRQKQDAIPNYTTGGVYVASSEQEGKPSDEGLATAELILASCKPMSS